MLKKTKIIATIGPSTNHPHLISRLIKKGMNVARLNTAHLTDENNIKELVNSIREESAKLNIHVSILLDLAGPKIRVDLSNIGDGTLKVSKNHIYNMGYSKMNDIPINLDINFKNSSGERAFVKVDDGKISFKVLSIRNNVLKLKAENDGIIKSKKGVNFPGVNLRIPAVTEQDKKNIEIGIKLKVDWLALSFVRAHEDIDEIKNILKVENKSIPVIAKIEKPEAIENLSKIVETFDGILIARGDLGVEMELSQLPILQKKIIRQCRYYKKPVIIATQILESMIKNSTPTRAEVNDVANAVYEGVDAVMLSGETAVGEYPIETIEIMNKIIVNIEKELVDFNIKEISDVDTNDYRSAIGKAVQIVSKTLMIDAIVIMTESGSTAKILSHYKSKANIFALSPNGAVCSQMSLYWGITPIKTDEYLSTDEMLLNAERILLEQKLIKKGQTFVMTAGIPVGVSGSTNMLRIKKIDKN